MYNWSTVICSSLLALFYSISLYLIYMKIQLPFLMKIMILLILSNVAALVVIWTNIGLTKDPFPGDIYWILFLQAFMTFIRDGCFNIGHWIFSYQYYSTAISMQYVFKQVQMPQNSQKNMALLNRLLLTANIAMPAMYAGILYYGNYKVVSTDRVVGPINQGGEWFWPYMFSRFSVGALQLVSGIFLLISVNIIRRFLVGSGMRDHVNYK